MGVAMIFPNVRGSTGYRKPYTELDNGFQREDAYKDIETLLPWLKLQPNIDGDRIMVTGGSYGGRITLAVATRDQDGTSCRPGGAGICSLVSFPEPTQAHRPELRRSRARARTPAGVRRHVCSTA